MVLVVGGYTKKRIVLHLPDHATDGKFQSVREHFVQNIELCESCVSKCLRYPPNTCIFIAAQYFANTPRILLIALLFAIDARVKVRC